MSAVTLMRAIVRESLGGKRSVAISAINHDSIRGNEYFLRYSTAGDYAGCQRGNTDRDESGKDAAIKPALKYVDIIQALEGEYDVFFRRGSTCEISTCLRASVYSASASRYGVQGVVTLRAHPVSDA